MATDVFQDKSKSVPRKTPANIKRIDFDVSEIGSRKAHLATINGGSSNSPIQHVKG